MNTNNDSTHSNVQSEIDGFSPRDVARAISLLAYRKVYNQREEVKRARKERNERVKLALRYVREHPELGGGM
jgi:hypothetical protein